MKIKNIIACSILTAITIIGDITVFATQDTFELRSGIEFGDTVEDIEKKETTLEKIDSDFIGIEFAGKIAGFDEASCLFFFDEDEQMYEMLYSFDADNCQTKDGAENAYKTLYDGLTRNYGNSLGNPSGSLELIYGKAIERMLTTVALFTSLGCPSDYVDYDEWIVDVDDWHVKIDLANYYCSDTDYNKIYHVALSYHKYTDEDYNEVANEKESERQEVDNDL